MIQVLQVQRPLCHVKDSFLIIACVLLNFLEWLPEPTAFAPAGATVGFFAFDDVPLVAQGTGLAHQ